MKKGQRKDRDECLYSYYFLIVGVQMFLSLLELQVYKREHSHYDLYTNLYACVCM